MANVSQPGGENQPSQPPASEQREPLRSVETAKGPISAEGEQVEEYVGVIEPQTEPTSRQLQEKTRRFIVHYLFAIFLIIIVFPLIMALLGRTIPDQLWEYLKVIFPAVTGLLGAAIAFYFRGSGDR